MPEPLNEAVTQQGLSYMLDNLPDSYKIADLMKYGQIDNDEQLKKAVDEEVQRLQKDQQKFIDDIISLANEIGVDIKAERISNNSFNIIINDNVKEKLIFENVTYYDYKNNPIDCKARIKDWGGFANPQELVDKLPKIIKLGK